MSHCTLGVGCDEYGVCYAEAHGEPDRCGRPPAAEKPIDMILLCPKCGTQHVDRDESNNRMHSPGCNVSCGTLGGCSCGFDSLWRNPPHRSHLCAGCGHIWRPADVPTNGVAAIKTKGKNDLWAKQ